MTAQQSPSRLAAGAHTIITSSLPSRPESTPCDWRCIHPKPFSRAQHCKVCHRTFTSPSAGDRHRIGEHGIDRRCLWTNLDLISAGLEQKPNLMWGWPPRASVPPQWRAADARTPSPGTSSPSTAQRTSKPKGHSGKRARR
jgi:hypothetical protein